MITVLANRVWSYSQGLSFMWQRFSCSVTWHKRTVLSSDWSLQSVLVWCKVIDHLLKKVIDHFTYKTHIVTWSITTYITWSRPYPSVYNTVNVTQIFISLTTRWLVFLSEDKSCLFKRGTLYFLEVRLTFKFISFYCLFLARKTKVL